MKPRYSRTCCTSFPISSQVITRYLKQGVVLSVCDLTEQQQKRLFMSLPFCEHKVTFETPLDKYTPKLSHCFNDN